MPALSIKDQQKQLTIYKLELINSDSEALDITLLFQSISLTESISNNFVALDINILTEYDIKEFMKMKGEEYLRIIWDSGDNSEIRDYTLRILDYPTQTDVNENILESVFFKCVDERFITLLSESQKYEIYSETLPSVILADMMDKYDIDLDIVASTSESPVTYYWMKDVFEAINDIRYATPDPFIIYQSGKKLIARTYNQLFADNRERFKLHIKNTNIENNEFATRIYNIQFSDLYDAFDIAEDGSGVIIRNKDLFNDVYSETEKLLTQQITKRRKFEPFSNAKYKVNFPNYKYIEDYYLTGFMNADIQYGYSNLKLGMLTNINIPSKLSKESANILSGDWLIYEITHTFDRNLNYKQTLRLINKYLFKQI
jgi:hypothetical protein